MAIYEERIARDMARISGLVEQLGNDVQEAVHRAIESLLSRDHSRANDIILHDHVINRAALLIGEKCHAYIALHMPSAGHLRRVTTDTTIADELERIADYAVTICRESLQIKTLPNGELGDKVNVLIELAKDTLRLALAALTTRNVEVAQATIVTADTAREQMDDAVALLTTSDKHAKALPRDLIGWFSIINSLERICLRAQNICEETLYIETGELAVEESRYYVLLLDSGNGSCGKLAEAIGRKHYKRDIKFISASKTPADTIDQNIVGFAEEKGLKLKGKPTSIDDLKMKPAAYDMIIGLQDDVSAFVSQQPYHSVFLNWNVVCDCDKGDLDTVYRNLRAQIDEFVSVLLGEGAAA